MQITVKLFANFRLGRFISASQEIAVGTTIAAVIDALQIPLSAIGTIMLNNRHADPDRQLQDGDRLALFPLIGGG